MIVRFHSERLQAARADQSALCRERTVRMPRIGKNQCRRLCVAIGHSKQQVTERRDLDSARRASFRFAGSSVYRVEVFALPGTDQTGGDFRRELGELRRAHVPVLGRLIRKRLQNRIATWLAELEKFVDGDVRLLVPHIRLEVLAVAYEFRLAPSFTVIRAMKVILATGTLAFETDSMLPPASA